MPPGANTFSTRLVSTKLPPFKKSARAREKLKFDCITSASAPTQNNNWCCSYYLSRATMRRRGALSIVLCHVWFVNAYISPPRRIRRPHTCVAPAYRPSITTASPQQSVGVVLQGSDEHQQQANITDRLWTYAYNIPKASRQNSFSNKDRTRPTVYSLVYLLREQTAPVQNDNASLQEALERSTIQAVRAASTIGDYRLIFKVVEAAINFAGEQKLLSARLFGEAIESLSRTSCNISKLKSMWKLAKESSSMIQAPGLGAFELNTMIKALASRGKIRAALDLYESEKDTIQGDAYTMSTLLSALTSSILDHQSPIEHDNGEMSPCWQYCEGRQLLGECSLDQLNNFVFAAALRLNERAGQVFGDPKQRHYTAKVAMDLLQLMKKRQVSPDVVTCSLVASAFDKAHQSKAAVSLLDAMIKSSATTTSEWKLAAPNEYIYSSVISACARCNDYNAALQVLDKMRRDDNCEINTWVYNAALKACSVGTGSRKQRTQQGRMAMTLLAEMKQDCEREMNAVPDTISYNTVLAAIGGMGAVEYTRDENQLFSNPMSMEIAEECENVLASQLVKEMKQNGILRDTLTYRNAIKSIGTNTNAVLAMLDAAIDDLGADDLDAMTPVFNSALSVLSYGEDFAPVTSAVSKMVGSGVPANLESFVHMFNALGSTGNSAYIPYMLLAIGGDEVSLDEVERLNDIDIQQLFRSESEPSLELKHYSAAIKACLAANDIDNAQQVLSLMRENNLSPDTESLEEIALTYCRLATLASAEESKIGRRVHSRSKKKKRTLRMDVKRSIAAARARSALEIALSLESPSVHLLSTVSKACCAAGLWTEGRMLLGRVHNAAVNAEQSSNDLRKNDPLCVMPGLHRSLLKICASKGNATAALGFVDDIQALSKTLASSTLPDETSPKEEILLSSFFEDESSSEEIDVPAFEFQVPNVGRSNGFIGMKGEDWKLLLIAASKAGHWRLCLGTLQFLKPFLEATHPKHKDESSSRKEQSKQYDLLARSLTAAILCFEIRGQYAWTLRAIEDWVEWSGRRPRKEAILGAFRILASRGQGYQVNRLLKQVLDVPATSFEDSQAASYEEILCTGALNSLHLHGLYEDADDLYVQACTQGYLPFSIDVADDTSSAYVLDLHGMNVAMANSAVRIALQQYALPSQQANDADMVIVTGRGMNSAQRLRPVLRPEVQRMLLEEFYPPLSTTSIPGNMGALKVPSQDVKQWVTEQRQQKGARMLAIADLLKNLTSGERIRKSIEKSLPQSPDEEQD